MLDKLIFSLNVIIYFLNFFVNVNFVIMIKNNDINFNNFQKIVFNWNQNFISNITILNNNNNNCPKNTFNFYEIDNNSDFNINYVNNLICLEYNKEFNYIDYFNLINNNYNNNILLNNSYKNCGNIDDLNNFLILIDKKECPNEINENKKINLNKDYKNLINFYNYTEFKIVIQNNDSNINNKKSIENIELNKNITKKNNYKFNIDNINYILLDNISFINFFKNE